eukprot:349929-Chlamydomonas_euryale.AAC.14
MWSSLPARNVRVTKNLSGGSSRSSSPTRPPSVWRPGERAAHRLVLWPNMQRSERGDRSSGVDAPQKRPTHSSGIGQPSFCSLISFTSRSSYARLRRVT